MLPLTASAVYGAGGWPAFLAHTAFFSAYGMPDSKLKLTGNPGSDLAVWNATITPGYTFAGALMLRAEYRFDKADEQVFAGEDTQHTVDGAVSYAF